MTNNNRTRLEDQEAALEAELEKRGKESATDKQVRAARATARPQRVKRGGPSATELQVARAIGVSLPKD